MTDQQFLELAMEHHRAGRLAEAEAIYRRLLAVHPQSADLIHLLGLIGHHTGHHAAALKLMQQAIAIQADRPHHFNNLGLLLHDMGRFEEALAAYARGVQLDPAFAEAHYNRGNTLRRLGRLEEAAEAFSAAGRLRAAYPDAFSNLGVVRMAQGRVLEAISAYRAGLEHAPRHAVLWNNLGNALRDSGDYTSAAEAFWTAIACDPAEAAFPNNLGDILKEHGDTAGALQCFRQSIALNPRLMEVRDNLIFTAHFDPQGETLLAEERQHWQAELNPRWEAAWQPHFNVRDPDRRLRIGYVSPDLRDHVVGRTLWPVFAAHDPAQVEVVCYSELTGGDAYTSRFREKATLWREITHWSNEQLAAQVRADGVDLLVDLALHTAYNRLGAFALKPAPVQVAWLGYPGTTLLSAIDYVLTDAQLDPPGLNDDYYVEELHRLPEAWCCYPAPEDSPAPNQLPMQQTGFVTFGSCNNIAKLNGPVFDAWAAILRAVENSRLRLLAKSTAQQSRIVAQFAPRGIAPERIDFFRYDRVLAGPGEILPQHGYLRRYHEIDLALDPFPYNGMTTTGDALWMGVPVVALIGKLPVSRASFSLLSTVGLPELAASTGEEYIRTAVDLARDPVRLAGLRAALRGKMEASPLRAPARLAAHVETAFRTMWRRWCARGS